MGGGEGASAFCRILYDSPYPHIGAISFGFKAVGISNKVAESQWKWLMLTGNTIRRMKNSLFDKIRQAWGDGNS